MPGKRPNLAKLDVICPMCAESYLETTKTFNPKKLANAGMLTLKKQYTAEGGGNQWTGPPPDPTAGYGFLECPGCEAPLASEGYLKVKGVEERLAESATKYSCPECPRKFDRKAHLGSHMRTHKKE